MTGHGRGSQPGASPGLLRRRYSVPETVMRKYKLAQQKSESEESEVGSAPSPRGRSPARGEVRLGGSRATERGPRSALLRRLLGREPTAPFGGSHSELRYWDSRSGSSSPRQPPSPERTCEACKRLSDKNLPSITRVDVHPAPIYKTYVNQSSRSPKRQKLTSMGSSGQSPERYITMLENARSEMLARESSLRQTTSPSTLMAGVSSPSERSSFKSVSLSEGSPKLRLSSLATSSYPATEGNSISEASSNLTRSSASCSSDDTSQSNANKINQNRPLTAGDTSNNDLHDETLDPKKRRRSVCIYMNSLDSPSVEIKSESVTDSSIPLASDSIITVQESSLSSTDNKSYSAFESIHNSETTSSAIPTTSSSTSEKTTTTESSSRTVTSSTRKDTTSPSDSAMSMHTSDSTSFNGTDNKPKSGTPSSADTENNEENRNRRRGDRDQMELSDTGISGTIETECDSNKNSYDEVDHNLSKPGSVANSDDCSTDINSDMVTCIENSLVHKMPHLKSSYIECLEVVVSETLNSSAFTNTKKKTTDGTRLTDVAKKYPMKENDHSKTVCSVLDIDQYVSNILIDSLNTMTDQINEINSNIDDDLKLNILEKEIKVKLQSVNASPINFTNSSIITSLLTHIPDKELLETTVIEEKTRSLAYTTESKMFPMENSTELLEKRSASDNYGNILKQEFLENNNVSEEKNLSISDSNILYVSNQEILNNNVDAKFYEERNDVSDSIEKNFYLANSTFHSSDLNENDEVSQNNITSKAVLQQLHKIFENSPQHTMESQSDDIDSNFNYCENSQPNQFFCQSAHNNISHLEMSTDVDVFVDNSLNKMMNSIDIDYNSTGLCKDIENMTIDNSQKDERDVITESYKKCETELDPDQNSQQGSKQDSKNIISNVGTGSPYQKLPQKPLVVPRYSAIPHSQSMEVNTSSDEEDSSCESDCVSLVDSLDDPSSPRQPLTYKEGVKPKLSKHDKKLVRGDIMSLLPENSTTETKPSKEKSETFFVPIAEDMTDCDRDVVVAEHMPEKIREKLFKREQKRELRKEHYRKKRMKQLKKDLQQQKITEMQKIKDEQEKECVEILSLLIDQVAEKAAKEEKKKHNKDQKLTQTSKKINEPEKKSLQNRKNSKLDKNSKKEDVSDFESFVVDKQGNIQMKNPRRLDDSLQEKLIDGRFDTKNVNSVNYLKNSMNSVERPLNVKTVKSKIIPDYKESKFDPHLSGPRRLYQKTEFKEGNKHVEILEIVECIDSSPEPSDESQDFFMSNFNRSKIPIPVHEKFHKISKNKTMQKSSKTSKSPVNKNAHFNTSACKGDTKNYKSTNPKMDQLIANILIEAFNEDNPNNRELQILSPRDKKSNDLPLKKLTLPSQAPLRRASIPQQNVANPNHDKVSILPKYHQKFDAIPEERSSVSVDSSNEEINSTNANRRASLPIKLKINQSKTTLPPSDSKKSFTLEREIESSSIKKSDESNDINKPVLSCSLTVVNEIVPNSINKSGVETQILKYVSLDKPVIYDVSTSPMPQYISTATSPIPLPSIDNKKNGNQSLQSKQMKGKTALTSRDGWAGFCRPHNGFSPEHEGSHPSSNNPSDREAFEKMKDTSSIQNLSTDVIEIAPPSQRILRTMDSRNNIRQISIHHEVGTSDKKIKTDKQKESASKINKDVERNNRHSNKTTLQDTSLKAISKIDKVHQKHVKIHDTQNDQSEQVTEIDSENQSGASFTRKHGNGKKTETKMQISENRDSINSKSLKLPSPFRNQSSTQSSETTSSGSDSEVGVTCPQLVPRWLPNAVPRYRRTVNRRPQRQDEQFHMPYQNMSGGWSVTLAGSCYTALPSDVEMKVSFPKNNQQQTTSQSDSGLGDEHNNYKKQASASQNVCKKCGNREILCQNCQTSPNCKCIATVINQPETESENQSFLPPAQIRKISRSSKLDDDGSVDPMVNSSKKYYQYLPDVNAIPGLRNRSKKSSMKMARRFSLHCWLPEDKLVGRQKVAKMEITETILPESRDELSVLGCAIMPETKPRVPTMSERDLTRVQTAQFYSRNRHL